MVCVLFNEYQYLSITVLGGLIVFRLFDVTGGRGGVGVGLDCLFGLRAGSPRVRKVNV